MALLQICQDAATEIGLDSQPVSIVGSPDPDMQRLLRFCNRVARDLAQRAPWQAMRRQRSFVAVADEVQANAIPADFARFYPETFFDQTNYLVISGPLDPVEYDSRKIAAQFYSGTGVARWFTRRGDDLLITPNPVGGETYTFDYQSSAFCQSAGGTPQSQWLADTDTGILNEELITLGVIARYLEADGQPSQAATAAYERRLAVVFGNDAPNGRVMVAGDIFAGSRRGTGEPSGLPGSGSWWW